jgi:hypothetical protein
MLDENGEIINSDTQWHPRMKRKLYVLAPTEVHIDD